MLSEAARGLAPLCADVPAAQFETSPWLRRYFRDMLHEVFSDVSTVTSLRTMLRWQGQDFGVPQNQSDEVFMSIMNYTLVDDISRGLWRFAPGVPHPRGKTGCEFWTSWEVTVMLGVNLCHFGQFRTLRMHCAISCGCRKGQNECPLSCHGFR